MSHARHLLLLVIALGIAACSTPYQATFLSGGYSEKQLEADLRNKLKLEAPLAVQARPEHAGFFPLNKFSTVPLM